LNIDESIFTLFTQFILISYSKLNIEFTNTSSGGDICMVSSLSAGTGPAAGILIGGLLILSGNAIGWLILFGGFGLSVLWATR